MSSIAHKSIESLIYRVRNATPRVYPYRHIYLNDVLTDGLYRELLSNLPLAEEMQPIEEVRPVKGYKERFVLTINSSLTKHVAKNKADFWIELSSRMRDGQFAHALLDCFKQDIDQRFLRNENLELYDEILLVNDRTNYSLGPHTDSPRKVITVLFYLPIDDSTPEYGTSLYRPKEEGFSCKGGPHHKFDRFNLVHTLGYLPNSMFAFAKSDTSFHGVEKLSAEGVNRWLMLYDIYQKT
jgi:hypothetical protein